MEKKVYRRILCTLYDHEQNWRVLTDKEIYVIVKKPVITETIRLHKSRWFGHVQRMEGNRIPKRVLYMNLESARLRGRPRNRWLDEVREDGRTVGGEEWQEKVYNREEWKKLLRTASNRPILRMPCATSCMSAYVTALNNSAPTGWIFVKFDTCIF
jgi:hypothetical protein